MSKDLLRGKRIYDLSTLEIGKKYLVNDEGVIFCGKFGKREFLFTHGNIDTWRSNWNIIGTKSRLKVYDVY